MKPILFSTPMIEAILDNRKKMTRRIVDREALNFLNEGFTPVFVTHKENNLCKYGNVGDILWVRETWQHTTNFGINIEDENAGYIYKASENGKDWQENTEGFVWKPSIFMPREACRLYLQITDVWIERLQDISEDDAMAEGIELVDYNCFRNYMAGKDWTYNGMNQKGFHMVEDPIGSFASLWVSINGQQSWDENPWVWVLTFEKKKMGG